MGDSGVSGRLLGASWGLSGASWGLEGLPWAISVVFGGHIGASRAGFGQFGAHTGACHPSVPAHGPSEEELFSRFGPSLKSARLLGTMLGRLLAILEAHRARLRTRGLQKEQLHHSTWFDLYMVQRLARCSRKDILLISFHPLGASFSMHAQ